MSGGATDLLSRLAAPVIVAPMFRVSTAGMVIIACRAGLMGSLPAHGARTPEDFRADLATIAAGLRAAGDEGLSPAPYAVNLVVHPSNRRLAEDLASCEAARVPVILTSKSAPGDVVRRVHGWGGIVLHDISTRRHAEKALEAGVDGLIAICAGAGGHTGRLNPFAFVNELRAFHSGLLVLAGGISTGRDAAAAQAMGADLVYMGTRFLATRQSGAAEGHKEMVVAAAASDIEYNATITGAPANWLRASMIAAGIDPAQGDFGARRVMALDEVPKAWKDVWSAGHGAGAIGEIADMPVLCRRIVSEYRMSGNRTPGGGGPNRTQSERTEDKAIG